VATLLFINLSDITELVVTARGFEEFAIIITDSSLTEFELKCDFAITFRVYEKSCTIVICLSLYGFFVFQEEPNNSDIDTQFICIWHRPRI